MTGGAPDTSVVVAGLSSWHPDHDRAREVLAKQPHGLAYVMVESYSVLTRLPLARRLDPALVLAALAHAFPGHPVSLPTRRLMPLLGRLRDAGISGGATYDGLVAETARAAGLNLISLDARARPTYAVVGVEVEWIG
jgi:predicted nucleic acid-binding protein